MDKYSEDFYTQLNQKISLFKINNPLTKDNLVLPEPDESELFENLKKTYEQQIFMMQERNSQSQFRDMTPEQIEEILKSWKNNNLMDEDNISEFLKYRNKIKEYKQAKENLLNKGYPEIKSYAYI